VLLSVQSPSEVIEKRQGHFDGVGLPSGVLCEDHRRAEASLSFKKASRWGRGFYLLPFTFVTAQV